MISKRLHPASFSNVNAQLAQKANIAQEAWITPTLLNSWVDFDGGLVYATCQYMKDTLGFVHIKGLVKSGTILAPIFVLPVGCRPGKVLHNQSVSNGGFGYMLVQPGGSVLAQSGNNSNFSVNFIFKAEG